MSDEAIATLHQRASAVLAALGRARVVPGKRLDGLAGGVHRSALRGGGVEFAEHKAYTPGDELRHIDWRAYARADRFLVKRFEQEVHGVVVLVLDASASMALDGVGVDDPAGASPAGPAAKLDAVVLWTACIALAVLAQGDAVGLVVAADPLEVVPAASGARQARALLRRLATLQARGEAGLELIAEGTLRQLPRDSRVLVLSDLLGEPAAMLGPLVRLRRAGAEVVVAHTLHPRELDLAFDEPVELACAETGHRQIVDARLVRGRYTELLQAHERALREVAVPAGVVMHALSTAAPPADAVRTLLESTRLRRGAGRFSGGAR